MDLLVLKYVINEEMKKTRYNDMLMGDIKEFVSISSCRALKDIIDKAWEQEIELNVWSKRKPVQDQEIEDTSKRPKTSNSQSRGHQGRGRCCNYNKLHDRVYRAGGSGCYMFGKTGHISQDCPQG